MARINKIRFSGWVLLLLAVLWMGGCTTSMQARDAFEEAEQFTDEENFDQAIEKYSEAVELEPGSKTYKLKMISAKTRAAATHIRRARVLTKEGRFSEAIVEYRIAKDYDQSVDIATQEEKEVLNLLGAEKLAEEGASFYGKGKLVLSSKAIDKALKLDANNPRALAIQDLLDRAQKKITMDGIELDVASEEPITLSFKDAKIKEVFGILSKLSGINFIFDEDIRSQSISVLLEKASFAQAMELIMQMNGLDKKVLNSKTIIIYPQSREKDKQYGDQIIQTFYLSHIDAKKAVNLLRTMLQLRKIYVHEERNAIVVRDKPEVIKLAEQILAAADRSDSEVLFDVEVLSVRDSDNLDFGPKLSAYSTGVGLSKDGTNILSDTLGATTSGLVQDLNNLHSFYTIPSASFDYAKTLSSTELLASPKIRVKNNEKAKVHIGKRDPVVTTSGSTTDSGFVSQNVQYVDSGIKLDIEPTVQLDGSVLTKIKLEVSTAERLNSADTTGTSPIALTTTNAETSLVLLDGARTILGGLFESNVIDNKSTIPFLGDIPLIGSLFTHFSKNKEKREIILSITPYIIKKVVLPDGDVATIWSGGEDNLKNGPNFGSFSQALMSEVDTIKPSAAPAAKPLQSVETGDVEILPSIEETPADTQASLAIAPKEAAITADVAVPLAVEQPAEIVQTEVMTEAETPGAPIVLDMPKSSPAAISFSGPAQAEPGKEFAVTVQVKDIEQLYSAPLFVSYDPAVLELVNISEGTFLKQEGQSTVFSSSPNRTTGQVIVGYKQGAGGKGASGSGNLFNLNFKPVAAGETKLEINRVNFRNPDGVRLQVVPETIMIEVL